MPDSTKTKTPQQAKLKASQARLRELLGRIKSEPGDKAAGALAAELDALDTLLSELGEALTASPTSKGVSPLWPHDMNDKDASTPGDWGHDPEGLHA